MIKEYDLGLFENGLKELGLSLSEEQKNKFITYYEMLIQWNSVMNLTAITEFQDVVQKHFLDSLSLVRACELSDQRLIDIGTGAGFPGIPLKIAFPQLQITLLDSLNKRVQFLDAVIQELHLDKINAVHGRAEDFAKQAEYREGFDLCVSRAVSNMTTLSEYCLPYVKVGGAFISYKSERLTQELEAAAHAISILGGSVQDQIEFHLPGSDIYRNLLVIKKDSSTPKKYPRKAGVPSKSPIN